LFASHSKRAGPRTPGLVAAFQPEDGDSSAMRSIPDAIDANCGEELRAMLRRGVLGDVEDYFPCWATSYATGSRTGVDAQGCGPGMWLNAQLVQRVRDAGLQVPMTGMLFATGDWRAYMLRLDKGECEMMRETHAVALVVLLTKALFRSKPCLDEIAMALQNKMKVLLLRCEDDIPWDSKEMWPLSEKLKAGEMSAKQDYMLKRKPVIAFMTTQNSIPTPGNTILTLPSAFDTFLDALRAATPAAAWAEEDRSAGDATPPAALARKMSQASITLMPFLKENNLISLLVLLRKLGAEAPVDLLDLDEGSVTSLGLKTLELTKWKRMLAKITPAAAGPGEPEPTSDRQQPGRRKTAQRAMRQPTNLGTALRPRCARSPMPSRRPRHQAWRACWKRNLPAHSRDGSRASSPSAASASSTLCPRRRSRSSPRRRATCARCASARAAAAPSRSSWTARRRRCSCGRKAPTLRSSGRRRCARRSRRARPSARHR